MVIAGSRDCSTTASDECIDIGSSGSSSSELENPMKSSKWQCATNLTTALDALYGDQAYLRVDYFNDTTCSDFIVVNVFVADGACHAMRYSDGDTVVDGILSKVANAWDNGTASIAWFYNTSDCSGAPDTVLTFTKEQQSTGKCQANTYGTGTIGYSNAVADDGGLSTGAIVGIVVGCVVFLALAAGLVVWLRRRRQRSDGSQTATAVTRSTDVQVPETPDPRGNPYQSAA